MKSIWHKWLVCGLLLATVLAGGCASPEMKGTPFYTGEYEEGEGEPEDRVNLWPLLYHRDPALSILWPLGELTEDHFAIRPVFSIYGLNKDEQIYNIVWPIAQIDMQRKEHRVFPLLWWGGDGGGSDYCVVFPLYWHYGDPFFGRRRGLNSLFPLWWYKRDKEEFRFFLPWPIIGGRNWNGEYGWHAWPLAGSYWEDKKSHDWALWPLAHRWNNPGAEEAGHCVMPFYWNSQDKDSYAMFTFPVGWGAAPDREESWHMVVPFYLTASGKQSRSFYTLLGGYSRQGKSWDWLLWPLLAGGQSGESYSESNYLLGLIRNESYRNDQGGERKQRVFPLYWYNRDRARGNLFVLPLLSNWQWDKDWSDTVLLAGLFRNRTGRDRLKQHAIPFYYYSRTGQSSLFLSLLYSQGYQPARKRSWRLVPPLFYHETDQDGHALITPLWAQGRSGEAGWNALIPLYYKSQDGDERTFATLLGWRTADATGSRWFALPLLGGGRLTKDTGDVWGLGPLVHSQWDAQGSGSHVLPLYYWNGWTRTFASLPVARWRNDDQTTTTLIPLALSWVTAGEKRSDLWILGPLAHASWGPEGGPWHVLPILYKSGGTFVSPALSWWNNERGGRTTLVPPAISWLTRGEQRSDLWLAGPLAHFSWGPQGGPWHVFPLIYRDGKTSISPLISSWNHADGRRTTLIPPALSWLTRGEQRSDLWLAGPLARFSWGPQGGPWHVFPLAYQNGDTFISPLAATWQRNDGRTTTLIPPALSWLTKGEKRSDLHLLGPLARFSWGPEGGPRHVFPLFYQNKSTFVSLPYATWKDGSCVNRLFPPLLSAYSRNGKQRDLWSLLGLFHNQWGDPDRANNGHFFPFYSYRAGKYVYTPLFGWDKKAAYFPTPLFGTRRGDTSGFWLGPLFSYKNKPSADRTRIKFLQLGKYKRRGEKSESYLFPLYYYENKGPVDSVPEGDGYRSGEYGKSFFSLPACWYDNLSRVIKRDGEVAWRKNTKRSGIFPLYSYSNKTISIAGKERTRGRFLMFLYDYKREIKPSEDKPGTTDDYTRSRVLWRMWHYERSNGDVSVDVFPAITYDKKKNGFKKISFLHKVFRYEKKPKRSTKINILYRLFRYVKRPGKSSKLDILFIPLMR
jgi:hypothetical protein